MAASSRFANVSDKEISEIKICAVPKSTQNATKYGVNFLKVSKPLSLNLLVYFETLQTATGQQRLKYM